MRAALKEWAVVIEAAAAGEQSFLLRKGGIAEGRRGFELKHRKFALFPTWEHQQKELPRPDSRELFERLRPADPERVEIRCWAEAVDVFRAPEDRRAFDAVPSVWAPEYFDVRYDYRPDLPLFVVVPKVYKCISPATLERARFYRGCRSWVDLDCEINIEGSRPAMDESEFDSRWKALKEALGTPKSGAQRLGGA